MTTQKTDWGAFDKGVFLVNALAIIFDPKTRKILIGLRKNDPHIKQLSWCFPGGRPTYGGAITESLKEDVKKKTGLGVKVMGLIFASCYKEKPEFLSLYYFCTVMAGASDACVARVGEKFVELKWVKPSEIKSYFTTSTPGDIEEFLRRLEGGKVR